MSSKLLLFIDAALSGFVLFFAVLFRLRTKIFNYFNVASKSEKVLVIKFLGAGNFVAMTDVLKYENCTILSVLGNQAALKEFVPSAKFIFINERNIISLMASSVSILIKLLFSNYSRIVNLEAESAFAKLIAAVPYACELNGLSNKYKSIADWYFYDYYLVSPSNLNRDRILKILLRSEIPRVNNINISILENINNHIVKGNSIENKKIAIVSPTCSSMDVNRRLSIATWKIVIQELVENFETVFIMFPTISDSQYGAIKSIVDAYNLKRIELVVESYKQFVSRISTCDILITIDSQALHIGQQLEKNVVCFYGPTSPHGVKLGSKTYVVSKEFECSPCTHKYFTEPCRGSVDCMQFDGQKVVSILKKIVE